MYRTAIIVDKNFSIGEQSNAIDIVSGALASKSHEIFDENELVDQTGYQHAAIRNNLVILKATPNALLSFGEKAKNCAQIKGVVFTKNGQNLSNSYSEYENEIMSHRLDELNPIGIGIFGEQTLVKELTKKFSLLK